MNNFDFRNTKPYLRRRQTASDGNGKAEKLTMATIDETLDKFDSISLDEMKDIRLMNRTDTKFVTSRRKLMQLLQLATDDYYVQEIDGRRIGEYYTVYFDTPDYAMFRTHHCGHANRQKLRIRCYVESKQSFLEVKTKDNHSRTHKKRIKMPCFDPTEPRYDVRFGGCEEQLADCDTFVREYLRYDASCLSERIENRFRRITLVNKGKTERLTIDLDLSFRNLVTAREKSLDNIVIIELKRDGLIKSPVIDMLKEVRIKKSGFSKYCIGTAFTYPELRQNRFKNRLRKVERIQNEHVNCGNVAVADT